MGVRSFTAVVHREGEEYVAICPEMGTAARGATSTDAVEKLRLATEMAAREYPPPRDDDESSPVFVTQFQVVTPDDTATEMNENE